jgi:hypothetical protein
LPKFDLFDIIVDCFGVLNLIKKLEKWDNWIDGGGWGLGIGVVEGGGGVGG